MHNNLRRPAAHVCCLKTVLKPKCWNKLPHHQHAAVNRMLVCEAMQHAHLVNVSSAQAAAAVERSGKRLHLRGRRMHASLMWNLRWSTRTAVSRDSGGGSWVPTQLHPGSSGARPACAVYIELPLSQPSKGKALETSSSALNSHHAGAGVGGRPEVAEVHIVLGPGAVVGSGGGHRSLQATEADLVTVGALPAFGINISVSQRR